jgi:transposase
VWPTLLPNTEYAVLTSVPGWGSVRAAAYAAALGPISWWPAAAKIYRAAGLTPTVYESAGRRRDGGMSHTRPGGWQQRDEVDLRES